MTKQFFKYPKVRSFRDAVETLLYMTGDLNKGIRYTRTPKIHGTNAGVVFKFDENLKIVDVYAQSRNRVITPEQDNAGFAQWVEDNKEGLIKIVDQFKVDFGNMVGPGPNYDYAEYLVLYGEWCGPGVQSGAAVNQLDEKMFVIFGYGEFFGDEEIAKTYNYVSPLDTCEIDTEVFKNEAINVYPITLFDAVDVEIDFSGDLEQVQADLLADAEKAGRECPVAKYFGIEGPGEGYVYHVTNQRHTPYTFKVKAEARRTSKTKLVSKAYKLHEYNALVDDICTDVRLRQGLEYLVEMYPNTKLAEVHTGPFIGWVIKDTLAEEGSVIEASGLDKKLVNSVLAKRAREFYFDYLFEATEVKFKF